MSEKSREKDISEETLYFVVFAVFICGGPISDLVFGIPIFSK